MKLINLISGKAFPMEKVGECAGLSGEVIVDDRKTTVEWVVQVETAEAALPLVPEVEVLAASAEDRRLLEDATLDVRFDGDVAFERASLFKKRDRLTRPPQRYWFAAIDQDEPCGVFLVNGTVIQLVIELEKKPSRKGMRLNVSLAAGLYRQAKGKGAHESGIR